jgi:hypothetical protein
MIDTDEEIKWHNDGHVVFLQLNKSNLEITAVVCPHIGKEDSPCIHNDVPCVVEYFLQIYGLECNVGVVEPSAIIPVAWAFIGDQHKDLGSCQVWVIPTEDEAFSAWLATQGS